MDTTMKSHKSLPPLVEGKIHGYLKLIVDEIIWSKRSLGEVRILVYWWGETDSAQCRPADITKNVVRSEQETTVIYAIRTNINLFEEYVKNSEYIKLAIVTEENDTVVGIARVTNLLEIFEFKPFFKYIPIINDIGNNIGKVHVSIKLEYMSKVSNTRLKTVRLERKHNFECNALPTVDSLKNLKEAINDKYSLCRKLTSEEGDVYKSILKSKRTELQEPLKNINNCVTDKLVARVVTKAQKLRGAILEESCTDDSSDYSNNSFGYSLKSHNPIEDRLEVCKYFVDKDENSFDKDKASSTLRSASTASSSINLASRSKPYESDEKEIMSLTEGNFFLANEKLKEKSCTKQREKLQSNGINFIRIFIDSFTLSPAGYGRVRSSSLLQNDSSLSSATYFIRYDVPFGRTEKKEQKSTKENKCTSIYSKTQTNRVIIFNHDGIYRVSKLKPWTEYCIKFKVFVRHLNRKSLLELGTGTIYINDIIKHENWSIAHNLIIVNKGLKIGELSMIVELRSDCIKFANKYVDAIASCKENISIVGTSKRQLSSEEKKKKSVSATETQSKTTSQVSSASTKQPNKNFLTAKGVSRSERNNMDDKKIDAKDRESDVEDKILLHGLIYIAEGKELPKLNTYLICRAFWKEDKSRSQICNDTKNPFYQFCQLVPLVHDIDLLNRIKDNYIIIEVHYKNHNVDNLLGLTKLPVHQLYVAYSDPCVLPHLLLSKYPVVSTDGWVPIIDPVTGKSCGELLALVALGTVEQINTLLEMSRGLTNIAALSLQTVNCSETAPSCFQHVQSRRESVKRNPHELQSNIEEYSPNDVQVHFTNINKHKACFSNKKSQECQTDISLVKELKFDNEKSQEETSASECSVLNTLVGRLTQVLNVNKPDTVDRAIETNNRMDLEKKEINVEEDMQMDTSYDESDVGSIRQNMNIHLPVESYRSVGVGAEYDEGANPNYDSIEFPSPIVIHKEKEAADFSRDATTFRAVVEIECAMHLPEIEETNETVAPSTYVSFQAYKSNPSKQYDSYIITNVYPYSCNPKWNWKCDTELPVELLLHNEKRLILKIWRLLDAKTSMHVNLKEDIVIGFSAIDLTILINGFPTVSGWFHIMDCTGKSNGQIKVCITPMDNLSLFGKSLLTSKNTARIPMCNVPRSSWTWLPNTHQMHSVHAEESDSMSVQEETKQIYYENQPNDSAAHVAFEDASMSFLSLSLKQKLTELDEITKRLESRLRDVTSTAFQDDFENDFELNEPNGDNETNEHKSSDVVSSVVSTNYRTESGKKLSNNAFTDVILNDNSNVPSESETSNRSLQSYSDNRRAINLGIVRSSSSKAKVSNGHREESLSNDHCETHHRDKYVIQDTKLLEKSSFSDFPERGTKTHINCLLDKLSSQFPLQLRSTEYSDNFATRSSTDSAINLRENSNANVTTVTWNNDYSPTLKLCTIPTQTDNVDNEQRSQTSDNLMTNCSIDENLSNDQKSSDMFAQSEISNKISKLVREELVIAENSDATKFDELTSYLVASNVRHMDFKNIFNPLLYQHLVPDLNNSKVSSEEEAVEQLDNRYVKIFSKLIGSTLNKGEDFVEANRPHRENTELFRTTPSGIAENVDGKIDLTVVRKSSSNDLLASNRTNSTTTISLEKSVDSESIENSSSISSEISGPVLSRQAPDGGNPVEDMVKPSTLKQSNQVQEESQKACN